MVVYETSDGIVAMTEEEVMLLPHELMTPFEFENEWNADIKGLFDSTKQFSGRSERVYNWIPQY